MDGMFYDRRVEPSEREHAPAQSSASLLLITMATVIAVFGVMLLLSSAGVKLASPDEYPAPSLSD